MSPEAGHCTAPAVRVVYAPTEPTTRYMLCEGHPSWANFYTDALDCASATVEEYEAAHGTLVQDAVMGGSRRAPRDAEAAPEPAPEAECEVFRSEEAGHCTGRAVRVARAVTDPSVRVVLCERHPRMFADAAWESVTPDAYHALYGPLVPDAGIIGGRRGPKVTAPPLRRPTRCEDCGERIEVDEDGFRTLCACDVTA